MKRHLYQAAAILSLGLPIAAITAQTVSTPKNMRMLPAVKVLTPAMSDSTNNKGAKFEKQQLLDTRISDNFDSQRATVISTTKLPGGGTMRIIPLRALLRAPQYAKGKLVIKSDAPLAADIDGKEVARLKDATTADSVTADLSMQPYLDYELTIKVLADADVSPNLDVKFVPDKEYADVAIDFDSEMGRRFNVDNCVNGTRIRSTRLSPDGKYTILVYQEYFSPKDSRWFARVVETATGKIVADDLPNRANWIPSTSKVYFFKNGAKDKDLFTMDIPSMKMERIATKVEDSDVTFSPDGKSFIYYREEKAKETEGFLRRYKSPDDRIPGNADRVQMVLQYLDGNTQNLSYGTKSVSLLDFSPDSKKILYMSTFETTDKWPFYSNSLVQMDLATLKTDTIVKNDGFINGAIYSPDGKQLFVYGGPNMLGGVGINAGNHDIPNDFDTQGAILNIADGKVTPMTRDFDPSISGDPYWNHKNGKIYFNTTEGFYKNIYSLDPKTGKFTKIPTSVDVVFNFSMSDSDDKCFTYTGSTLRSDGQAWVCDLKTDKSRLLDDPFSEITSKIDFGKSEHWTFTADDGTLIDGTITLPPDFDITKKYPLIVYYYGGTSPSANRIDHPYSPQVFASRGYVVYVVNPSGTIGYGQEFSARHVNAWGKRTAEDIIQGVKEFCKAHPFVDDKKIGCLGASYGGFMTQYLQTQTDIFAAAVSHAGISNLTSYWGEGYWGYSYNAVAAAKSYPWTDPKLFTEQGSLFNADKIHAPLLLLHGTEDTNVPIGESIQLFNALKILGREVEFITVDGQNHVITEPDHRRVWQNTIMAWFDKWLKDQPQWWDSLYGE